MKLEATPRAGEQIRPVRARWMVVNDDEGVANWLGGLLDAQAAATKL